MTRTVSTTLVIYSKFHRNPFRGLGAPGVEICLFPLLWLLAFTTACLHYRASRDAVEALQPSQSAVRNLNHLDD